MKRLSLAALAALLLWSGPAWGQNAALRGIKGVEIFVPPLSAEEKKCGVSEAMLRTALSFPISTSAIKIANEPIYPVAEINITSLHIEEKQMCASMLSVEIYTIKHLQWYDTQNAFAEVGLWVKHLFDASTINEHAARVRNAVESAARQFVVDWDAAQ